MNEDQVIEIIAAAMAVAFKVSAPVLVTAVAVGVFMGLLQSVTQIQEQTLAFVPKFLAVGLAILVSGSWVLRQMIDFTLDLIDRLPELL